MAIVHGRRAMPPRQPVSITDGVTQIQFDGPADFLLYLDRHPELASAIREGRWAWTVEPVAGGH